MRVLVLGVLLGSAILASLLPSASASSGSLTLQVEPQTEECFYEEVENGKTLNMNFEVIRGGLLDIQVRIYNPKSRVVYEKMAYFSRKTGDESENEGKVSVVATFTGVHKICFDNTMSRWTAKVVTFHIGDAPKAHHEDIARLEHLGPVVDSVIKISDDLDTVERLQHHMRVRERVHRDTIENTASRVQWMHVIETLVLIALGFFEVSYIRAWFNDTAKAGRV